MFALERFRGHTINQTMWHEGDTVVVSAILTNLGKSLAMWTMDKRNYGQKKCVYSLGEKNGSWDGQC